MRISYSIPQHSHLISSGNPKLRVSKLWIFLVSSLFPNVVLVFYYLFNHDFFLFLECCFGRASLRANMTCYLSPAQVPVTLSTKARQRCILPLMGFELEPYVSPLTTRRQPWVLFIYSISIYVSLLLFGESNKVFFYHILLILFKYFESLNIVYFYVVSKFVHFILCSNSYQKLVRLTIVLRKGSHKLKWKEYEFLCN